MDASTELMSTRSLLRPKFFYCCKGGTNQLYRMSLFTGEQSCHKVPNYQFKAYCRVNELTGGNLLITGGGVVEVGEVVKIDTLRECAVSSLPPMHTPRFHHAAVYHSQYLYVLGGYNLSKCERYSCTENRWEVLPALPVAGCEISAVVLDNSVYALGGYYRPQSLDTVQKLSLDSLTWELMQLKLPQAAHYIPCFSTETQVYLMINETMYSFTPLHFKPIKTVPPIICVTSYYSRGTLYYEMLGEVNSLAVGELA
jgi:hypothetical protein